MTSDDAPGPIDDLIPEPAFMAPMWVACLIHTIGRPDALAAFRADTGCEWEPGATPLERLVDRAAGAELEFVRAFVAWFNANVWGDAEADPGGDGAEMSSPLSSAS